MQTIPSTFEQYAAKGHNTNILDPLQNIAAGINYAVARYGSLQNVPGIVELASGGRYVGY
jgi:SLT domain-containing protein